MSTSGPGGFNFLEHPELPAPAVSDTQARTILAEHYGIQAAVQSLGSQQDKNFLARSADGSVLGVLKIANPAFGAVEIEAQRFVGVKRTSGSDERLCEVGVDAPMVRLVGVGQGGACDLAAEAHVVELAAEGSQTGFDIAEAFAVAQLGEGHR